MILQSKYIQDGNGVKYAPITTPNAIRWPDGGNLNDKLSAFDTVVIETPVNATDATLPVTALACEVGKYYRIDVAVETLAITLPAMTDLTTVRAVVIYLTGGVAPAVSIFSTAVSGGTAPDIYYLGEHDIKAGGKYEITCTWNGLCWIVTSITDSTPHLELYYIEYLESTGTQFINLGKNFSTSSYKVKARVSPLELTGTTHENYQGLMGNNGAPQIGWYNSGWTQGNSGSQTPYAPEVGVIYEIEYSKNLTGDYWVDGESTGLSRTGTLGGTLFICGGKNSKLRLYELQVLNADNEIEMDLVPIRFSSTGYLYDKVSNTIFFNNGTGDFILGPDK